MKNQCINRLVKQIPIGKYQGIGKFVDVALNNRLYRLCFQIIAIYC